MLHLLHGDVRGRAEDLRREFAAGKPFRHVVIERFLDPAFCGELIGGFPAFDVERATNEHGEAGRKAVYPNVRELGAAYAAFDDLMRAPEFLDLMGNITSIPNLLYDAEYIGGGTHENLDGQELDVHVDFNYHPAQHFHRRLNLIVFLNPEWDDAWGGQLELLRDPRANGAAESKTVAPLANRCVIFETTEASWHGFPRIRIPPEKNVSRRSIAVYFYTKDRPAPETTLAHGTIYYQRPLAANIREGHTLSGQDVEEINILLKRRDKQIEFLYQRELEFSKVLADTMKSPSMRVGRTLTWPARALRNLLSSK